jgi:hypothetical protein
MNRFVAIILVLSTPAFAQNGQGGGGPPVGNGPIGNGPNGGGFQAPGGNQANAVVPGRNPRLNRRPTLSMGLVDYFAYADTVPMWTIDTPITGFGNDALSEDWELPRVAAPSAPSTGIVASR